MKPMMNLFKTPDQVIALILVIGCLILIFCKIDGEVKSILTLAAGWSFGGAFAAGKAK